MPHRGPGEALVAAPLASLIAACGFVALNTALGGALLSTFIVTAVQRPLGLGLLLSVLVATAAIGAPRLAPAPATPARPAILVACAVLGATAVSGVVIAARASLIPSLGDTSTSAQPDDPVGTGISASGYVITVVPEITTRYIGIENALKGIVASTGEGRVIARRVRSDVVEPLQDLAHDARSLPIDDIEVRAVHREAIAALDLATAAFTDFADAHQQGDPELLQQVGRIRAEESSHWQLWQAGVVELGLRSTGG